MCALRRRIREEALEAKTVVALDGGGEVGSSLRARNAGAAQARVAVHENVQLARRGLRDLCQT